MSRPEKEILERLGVDGLHRVLRDLLDQNRLVRLANTARFTRTMSILVSSGVTALDSMHISTEVINNQPIKDAVIKAADRVREGEYISTALENTRYFSPMVVQLVQNGESSGKLGEMLERSARAEENEFINAVRSRVKQWREDGYRGITKTTARLLEYWREDERNLPLFFCQLEAVETAIYITEAAKQYGDQYTLNKLQEFKY